MDSNILFQIKIAVFLLGILRVKCPQVIDSHTQQGLFVSEYCKRIGVCPEGTHVMCTHFNPNRTRGPLCVGDRNETITPEYAKLILDLLNLLYRIIEKKLFSSIRSRSAYGTTTGLSNLTLPRGYGLYRLQWDPELSTLAQVWANTCIVAFDVCRATKRFSDPGQLAGLTRFDADWIPINARRLFNYTGFSLEKVKYGIHSTLRSWYRTKEIVHPDDITNKDDIWPKHLGRNVFLNIVHGRSTHVGCGISIFEEFDYDDSVEHKMKLVHNVVRVVCNLSSRLLETPRKDRVYTVDPPKQVGYTVKCGCPIGFDEDEDCLCYRSGRKMPFSCKSKECKPAVVILPIFTVEKAPLTKLRKDVNHRKMMTNEIHSDHQDLDNTRARRHDLRGSIFLKPSVFELPPRKLKNIDNIVTKTAKKDVNPLINSSNVRNLVRSTKVMNSLSLDNRDMTELEFQHITKLYHNISNIKEKNQIKPMRRKIFHDNANSTRIPNKNFDEILSNNKLMNLLNKLEEESKVVQIPCDRKHVLDYKIRKIYYQFLEKILSPRNFLNMNEHTYRTETDDNFSRHDSLHKNQEQFKTVREEDPGNNPMPNKQGYNKHFLKINLLDEFDNKPQNYASVDELLAIRNINEYRKMKGEKSNGVKKENSLSHGEDDILSLERRKFYQDKLNNLERRLRNVYNHRSKIKMYADQHHRRMLPTYRERQL